MKKYLIKLKYIVLGTFVSLTACVSDDLANVGDLEDITGPTPFYNLTDVTSSEFDCNDVELWAKYDFNFQGGSNLAVNGTSYQWSVSPSENVALINKDLPILEKSIEAELAAIVALEKEIAKRKFKLPCETNQAKKDVLEAQIVDFEAQLANAQDALSDETIQNVADLESQIANLPAATLQDRELIFSFPGPGEYTVGLTVTDNLGKSDYTEKLVTVNQAIPTIPIPEIGEPGFEDNSLFDGTGDGRDSWRSPSSSRWGSVFQINTDSNGRGEGSDLPEGVQAAKFPSDGTRTGYQEIEVTPGATYVLTYFTAFEETSFGDVTVSIVSTNADSLEDAKLEANIIASRTDTNVGRVDNVFKKHAITFEAGENEAVIILITNSGVESRVDAFDITVKQ
ncbi:hypothetical protein FPF71_06205 [Algibacter amylolyticus]|uniref:DUF5013 domain-containing protein n=1 Tax=Algibacter amylolyticus TaxID=1608400 RepID=A0A5M7BDT5_9FLAO|nr:hypothetical protein [Algibacter amylolyticus]KAA5826407.1 hypothetical protein F2B50_06205 [Algibacter amylolyticus]MBB5268614.1 hypothetical protein [Algibacter amylolyticus]TSJ80445.1 hypothetical protein FPF71_06205 [Algibacter amylolyticus]